MTQVRFLLPVSTVHDGPKAETWCWPGQLDLVPLVDDMVEIFPGGARIKVNHRTWVLAGEHVGGGEVQLMLQSTYASKERLERLRLAGWVPWE